MLDVDQLAADAARVAEFAAGVAAAARLPADTPAGLIRAWARQAALAHRWAAVRPLVRGPGGPDPALAGDARRVAERCRGHRPGVLGKAIGLFRRSPTAPAAPLEEAAAALDRLADAVAPRPGGDLVAGLDAVLEEWRAAGSAPARLIELQAALDDRV